MALEATEVGLKHCKNKYSNQYALPNSPFLLVLLSTFILLSKVLSIFCLSIVGALSLQGRSVVGAPLQKAGPERCRSANTLEKMGSIVWFY